MDQERLVKQYFSSHYTRFIPKTKEGWQWVTKRIDLNFGKIFDTLPKDSFILDIPCGVGYLESYLLEKGFINICSVDLSEKQINVAKNKLHEYGFDFVNKVNFYISDAFEYLKKHNGYSAIAVIDFLEHLKKENVLEILNLIYSSLNSGGFLFIRATSADSPVWGRYFYRDFTHETPFTIETLHQCLSNSGFKVIKLGYETMPTTKINPLALMTRFRQFIYQKRLKYLGGLLGIPIEAFTEDLIAVAKKP